MAQKNYQIRGGRYFTKARDNDQMAPTSRASLLKACGCLSFITRPTVQVKSRMVGLFPFTGDESLSGQVFDGFLFCRLGAPEMPAGKTGWMNARFFRAPKSRVNHQFNDTIH